jgi:tetratricopeptide (TPR) repeat protein
MGLRYLLLMFALGVSSAAIAQKRYTAADSSRAKAYFDSSWSYSMGSVKHQQYLDSALMILPQHAYYWQQKAMPLYKSGKIELAKPFLDSAVKYDAGRWLSYRAFMRCMFENNYKGALKDFYAAIRLDGEGGVMDHPFSFYMGLCHLQLNRFDSSEYYLLKSLQKSGHHTRLFYLGVVYAETEAPEEAISYFDKALRAYPGLPDALYHKANCLYKLGKKAEALRNMQLAYDNYRQGYTLNEDSQWYVYYPYQAKKYYLEQGLEKMKAAVEAQND